MYDQKHSFKIDWYSNFKLAGTPTRPSLGRAEVGSVPRATPHHRRFPSPFSGTTIGSARPRSSP